MKKILILGIIAATLFSCKELNNRKEGNGDVTFSTREVTENFNKIEVSRAIDVEIEQANTNSIEIEADSNLINEIKTTVEDGVLKIHANVNFENAKKTLVKVKTKNLISIETTSAASLKSINILKGKNLQIRATSASDIDIEAEYENINIETTSASEVVIKGKTLKLETSAASASDINAEELLANDVYAHATSASQINVHAIVKLDAKATSTASIISAKSPKELRKEETSGGAVTIQ